MRLAPATPRISAFGVFIGRYDCGRPRAEVTSAPAPTQQRALIFLTTTLFAPSIALCGLLEVTAGRKEVCPPRRIDITLAG